TQDVCDLRKRSAARASRRVFRRQHRIPPDHHQAQPQRRPDRSCRKSFHSYAHDPTQDNRRKGSRRPVDPRPHEHHQGTGSARNQPRGRTGARPRARTCRSRVALCRLLGLTCRTSSNARGHARHRKLNDGRPAMAEAAVKEKHPTATGETQQELTDGFHLIIDALKLNGLHTIYGVPGIPITDFGRMAQAAGIRVISFRHEQNAGYAASVAGFLTKKPGVCLTVSAPGFLNGLTALAHATTNCFPMILISGSSEREIVDLQQGDYEEMDQLAIARPLCKAAFRVLHAQDIGIGLARAIRAAVSGRPGGVYLDLPAKLFGQVMSAEAGKKSLVKVIDAAPAQ